MQQLSLRGGFRVFLLGSSDANLDAMRARIAINYPGVVVAGTLSPPFRDEFSDSESARMVAAINDSKADVLWVGMTAPKQEKWIYKHLAQTNVRFAGAIGAVFDYYTGRVKRPSALARRLGLEWLVRLAREPRRLWRRNLISTPRFAYRVAADLLRNGRRRRLDDSSIRSG
jgi:N-acetylglucosaminyldiphosphoundecaprenol N-acetyl-beta-D-mannosaminyltransferase